MYKPTSRQKTLNDIEFVIGPNKLEKLRETWAHRYREKVLIMIDEDEFAALFHDELGAPNKSVRLLVSLLLFKELFNLTDREVVQNFLWNAQWHYALDVSPVEAELCRKTIHNFRVLLIDSDKGRSIFDDLTNRIAELGGLNFSLQRQDSTHIYSNMKLLRRLGLFVKTIEMFLRKVKNRAPSLLENLKQSIHERYLEREGYFADSRSSKAKRRLSACARDVWYLLDVFRENSEISKLRQYLNLSRLFEEQCKFEAGAGSEEERVALKDPKSDKKEDHIPADSLQSPSDPDATYGHKGKGYEAQLSETCSEENDFQVITDAELTDSCDVDQNQLMPSLERREAADRKPETNFADAGFVSTENIEASRESGVELHGPLSDGAEKADLLHLQDFELDGEGKISSCPQSQSPVAESPQGDEPVSIETEFDRETCESCPKASKCPVMRNELKNDLRRAKNKRKRERKRKRKPGRRKNPKIKTTRKSRTRAQHRQRQAEPEFKKSYKIRSGIEATNSEFKRRHGSFRVRGKTRMAFALFMKATAINIKRFVNYVAEPGQVCPALATSTV